MSLLESPSDAQSQHRRLLLWVGLTALVLLSIVLWLAFRFYPEKQAAEKFFDALVAGDTARAYQLWKPGSSYKMADFLADWGPNGYYGPVKSYHIKSVGYPHGGKNPSGVLVTVEISPFSPFPPPEDVEKSRKTKVVTIWVETRDKSFSFPP